MITDDERREVARKLRDLAAEDLDDGEFYDCGEDIDGYGWSYCPNCGRRIVEQ